MDSDDSNNYYTFRDCFSELAIRRLSPSANARKPRRVKGRKNEIKPVERDVEQEAAELAAELSEFVEYLALEIFESFPKDLRTLSYGVIQEDEVLKQRYSTPLSTILLEDLVSGISLETVESLSTYGLVDTSDPSDIVRILEPILESYVAICTAVPPEHDYQTTATECQLCDRDQLPLTYHHLIPRQVHAKAVKRGWARESELQRVAWLCRACHNFVHRMASNEELARDYSAMDKILEREDVQSWARWVSRVRWKKR